jgi:hypothetical protein
MDKRKYTIIVKGCDDNTKVTMELTDIEYALIYKVAEAITDASTYCCKPTMEVYLDD